MWLDEQDSKDLVRQAGVRIPDGEVVTSAAAAHAAAERVGLPVYVKGLIPSADRAALGGIRQVTSAHAAAEAFASVTAATGATRVRVEQAVTASEWWYVGIGVPPGTSGVTILFSSEGGSGIASRTEQVDILQLRPANTPRDYHARSLLERAGLPQAYVRPLTETIQACHRLLESVDAELVELNPVAVTREGIVAVDARVIVDDYALYRQPAIAAFRHPPTGMDALVEELEQLGIAFVPLSGRVGIVGLGAGLTMHLADWLEEEGSSAAFFFDATTAAVRDWPRMFAGEDPEDFARALTRGLAQVRAMADVLLVNFTSGGTPVDSLCRGLGLALAAGAWSGPLIIHVGGNRSSEARKVLGRLGLRAEPTLEAAVAAAAQAPPVPSASP